MIPRILIMIIISIIGMRGLVKQVLKHQYTEIFPYFITIFLLIVFCYVFPLLISYWFKSYYTIELFEDRFTGYNLFGKKTGLHFTSIIKITKYKSFFNFGYDLMILDKTDKKHIINGDIDYDGFIHDYIIERCKDNAEIDYKFLEKIRSVPSRWKYTRRLNFDTKYENGYLKWLEPVVEAQKEMLIARGYLKADVFYGDKAKDLLWKKVER